MIIAFNAIQPLLLRDKLSGMGIEPYTWITDYLTARPQYVRLGVLEGTRRGLHLGLPVQLRALSCLQTTSDCGLHQKWTGGVQGTDQGLCHMV